MTEHAGGGLQDGYIPISERGSGTRLGHARVTRSLTGSDAQAASIRLNRAPGTETTDQPIPAEPASSRRGDRGLAVPLEFGVRPHREGNMRTDLLSCILAASLVAGCAASSPTTAPPSASAPPASSAPAATPAPTPAATPALTVPAAEPTPAPTPSHPVAAAESIMAVLAELPRLEGQRIKPDVGCWRSGDLWGLPGAVALCYTEAAGLRDWERRVEISAVTFTDAEHARDYFNANLSDVFPALEAPDIGEISHMNRGGMFACEYDITVLEGKTLVYFTFGGIGKTSAGSDKCRSWGSPPIEYAQKSFSMISNALGSP